MPPFPLRRLLHNHSRTLYLVLIVVCLDAATAIVFVGRPSVGEVKVAYPDNPDLKSRPIDLPFQRGSKDKVARFVIAANVTLPPFSSSILRISPDECIESITVNEGKPHDLSKLNKDERCFPDSHVFDAGDELRPGENTIRLEIKNEKGPYGVEGITPMLPRSAVLCVVTLVWAAVCAALLLYFGIGPEARFARQKTAARHLARSSFPALGLLMIAGQLINDRDVVSLKAPAFVLFAAVAVQAVLLLRILDKVRENPLRLRISMGWAVVCVLAFIALALKSLTGYDRIERFSLSVVGVVSGIFSVTPVFATLHRVRRIPAAVAIAGLAAAMPLAYDQLRLALWEMLVVPTTHAVAGIVSLLGWKSSTSFDEKRWSSGDIQDYLGYVTTQDFSVQIGAWCGGFEGMTLFLFLLASFVLFDWRFFSRTNELWVPFLATIPYLFAVNVLRIATILLYALLMAGEVDQDAARQVAVETFHSNAGWVIYSLAFGPYLSIVYWWARMKTRNA